MGNRTETGSPVTQAGLVISDFSEDRKETHQVTDKNEC